MQLEVFLLSDLAEFLIIGELKQYGMRCNRKCSTFLPALKLHSHVLHFWREGF